MISKIMEILAIPIMFLNFGGGIVGGIWLAFLGEWKLIGIGVLLLFTSHWFLSLLMMPGMLISGVAMGFAEKNKFILYLLGFLSQIYTNILIVATCVFAFFICSSYYNQPIGVNFIPYLLWSWGMALGPWQFFASKEPDNEFTMITLFCASIFYFLFLISIFISPVMTLIIIGLFGLVQLVVLPISNMVLAYKMENH